MEIKQLIFKTLEEVQELWDDEVLNYTKLFDLVENPNDESYKDVISLLLGNEELRTEFFVEVGGAYVFKANDFRFFMEESKVDNSYTAYKNKIGLTDGKRFLRDTNDVVLDFPYKDCVLAGGQTKEDQKRKEIFFNRVLAKDEIDRLEDAKAFTGWKRYTKDGVQEVGKLKRDSNGTLQENLIIKGNNYLVLHSLKKQFAGKIKLIYIDPPYNTGNDSFKYNDSFNHSTWLTFMKNRLEVAKKLLRDDGVIFVQCDDNEQAYLKVLMDEVFGRDNFIATAPRKTGAGAAAINSEYVLRKPYDFIVVFTKNKVKTKFNKLIVGAKEYKLEDEYGKYTLGVFQPTGSDATRERRPNLYYPIYFQKGGELSLERNGDTIREILPDKYKGEDGRWMWKREKFLNDSKKFLYFDGKKIKRKIYFDPTQDQNKYQVEKAYFDESNYRNSVGTLELKFMFDKIVFNNPKPEFLLKKIIEIATNSNDFILDFHLGSGTTCAVAHKMGRQYIGVEQMDYIETIAVERLKKVIAGEQGGISKAVNWQGGGDFIYFELAKWNETAKERILACKSLEELKVFFKEMTDKYFLNYDVKVKEFTEKTIKEQEFRDLKLAEQKSIFVEMLDNNQLYINKTEMADEKYKISESDQQLTTEFYK